MPESARHDLRLGGRWRDGQKREANVAENLSPLLIVTVRFESYSVDDPSCVAHQSGYRHHEALVNKSIHDGRGGRRLTAADAATARRDRNPKEFRLNAAKTFKSSRLRERLIGTDPSSSRSRSNSRWLRVRGRRPSPLGFDVVAIPRRSMARLTRGIDVPSLSAASAIVMSISLFYLFVPPRGHLLVRDILLRIGRGAQEHSRSIGLPGAAT